MPLACSPKHDGKGKPVSLQAWSGPEGSRKLRFPEFMTTAQRGGKVVSHMHRPHLPQEILLVHDVDTKFHDGRLVQKFRLDERARAHTHMRTRYDGLRSLRFGFIKK